MKIKFFLSRHISHRKAAIEYILCLKLLGIELVEKIEDADIVIIHDTADFFSIYFEKYPILKEKFIIGYVVWEADIVPPPFVNGLKFVNELWTPSNFSCDIFKKYYTNVHAIPHVVSKPILNDSSINKIKKLIKYKASNYYFYTITCFSNPRKDSASGLESFLKAQKFFSKNTYYIIKEYYDKSFCSIKKIDKMLNVININDDIDINALHAVCHCYVSPHHAEGWGLCISEAMSFGNMVVATGYSGNMEYMDKSNSLSVKYHMGNIKKEDSALGYREDMRWAYVDKDDLVEKMKYCYNIKSDKTMQENARKIVERFSHKNVAVLIKSRLDEIGKKLKCI